MSTSCDAAVYICNDLKFSTIREAHAIESYFKEIRRMLTPFRDNKRYEIVSKWAISSIYNWWLHFNDIILFLIFHREPGWTFFPAGNRYKCLIIVRPFRPSFSFYISLLHNTECLLRLYFFRCRWSNWTLTFFLSCLSIYPRGVMKVVHIILVLHLFHRCNFFFATTWYAGSNYRYFSSAKMRKNILISKLSQCSFDIL